MPFRATSARFEQSKTDDLPTIGTYYVTEDFGRQIKPWRRAPQWMKDKKRKLFLYIFYMFINTYRHIGSTVSVRIDGTKRRKAI